MLKLINITKIYKTVDEVVALDGVSLDINKGDFIAFTGPSGSGKTTLLSIIGGLIKPTSGEVYFYNKKLTHLPDRVWCEIRRKSFGFIFQQPVVVKYLNVFENIIIPAIFTEVMTKTEIKEKAEKLLKEFNLYEKRKFFPDKLSGGEIQKLMIIRGIITNPEILIADEPTGDLDKDSINLVMQMFKKLNRAGMTILMATHEKSIAFTAKTVYSLEKGKIKELLKDSKR